MRRRMPEWAETTLFTLGMIGLAILVLAAVIDKGRERGLV